MNLVVFGITWATGLEIVRHVLERGHSVTAMVRSPAPEHNPRRSNGPASSANVPY